MAADPLSQHPQPSAVVDASVWISRFLPSEAHHVSSRAWLTTQLSSGATLAAPNLLLVEIATAIARRTNNDPLAIQITQSLEQEPQLQLIEVSVHAARSRMRWAYAVAAAGSGRGSRPGGESPCWVAVQTAER